MNNQLKKLQKEVDKIEIKNDLEEVIIITKYIMELEEEIVRLNKIIERLVNYNELVYKRYDKKIKDHTIRSIVNHNLEIIKELKEEGKE